MLKLLIFAVLLTIDKIITRIQEYNQIELIGNGSNDPYIAARKLIL